MDIKLSLIIWGVSIYISVPLVIIHFQNPFSLPNHPAIGGTTGTIQSVASETFTEQGHSEYSEYSEFGSVDLVWINHGLSID